MSLPPEIRELAGAQVDAMHDLVAGLSDADLVAGTGCAGWLVAHLLVHVRLGLEETMGSFTEPTDKPADRDFVSYWRDWPAASETVTFAQVRWHWANASAYSVGGELRRHFTDRARAAAAVSRTAPTGRFRFQDHVMAAEDILAMWTVELVVHHLDLTAELPGLPGPVPEALSLTVRTLDLLADGSDRPPWWDDVTYVLKATGRVPLEPTDLEFLGEHTTRYPLFG